MGDDDAQAHSTATFTPHHPPPTHHDDDHHDDHHRRRRRHCWYLRFVSTLWGLAAYDNHDLCERLIA